MKNESALNVMEHVDADIIEEAENYTHKVKKNFWFAQQMLNQKAV